MEIQHFSHHHQLVLKNLKNKREGLCPVCYLYISELAYGCEDCNFKIHKSCSERPREMVHPFHPQHTLTLRANPLDGKSPSLECSVCRHSYPKLIFQCSDCEFGIDPNCASLTPTKKLRNNKMQQSILHRNLTHPHQLIPCDKKKNDSTLHECSCCNQPIMQGRLIYVCLEYNVFLDESCAQLLQLVIQQHPFHPSHPLTLTPKRLMSCDACDKNKFSSFYYCVQCDFQLDLGCAMLTSSSTNHIISNQDGHDGIKKHVITTTTTHPHPMIPCYKTKNNYGPYFCSACDLPLKDEEGNPIRIYVCLECKNFLHESCATLPRALKHPFHLPHPLSLVDNKIPLNRLRESYECAACMRTWPDVHGFLYICRECNVYLHIKCAKLIPPFINSQVHPEHPLAFLDIKARLCSSECKLPCNYPLFRCMKCRLDFCAHSLPELPLIVKHKCHLHPLTLTCSLIKDYEGEGDDSEFFCDACETHRRLKDPTYYCAECHYVAHVHCVISEVLPYLQIESWSLGDKLGTIKLDTALDVGEYNAGKKFFFVEDELGNINIVGDPVLDELDTKIAELRTGVDELKVEQEAVTTQLEALTRQLETKITELEQLKERRAEYNLSQQR